MRRRLSQAGVAPLVALVLGACGSAQADTEISSGPGEVVALEAYGGVLAWFREHQVKRPDGSTDTSYRLFVRRRGETRAAPIRPLARRPVRLDLGRGQHGGRTAVYLRCREDCDVFRLNLRTFNETRIAAPSSGRGELSPAYWRGTLVFGRGGPRGGLFATDPPRRIVRNVGGHPGHPDLVGDRVAFLAAGQADRQGGRIRVKRFDRRGRGRVCQVGTSRGAQKLSAPALTSRFVYWLARSGRQAVLLRRALPGRTCRQRGPVRMGSDLAGAVHLAIDGPRLFYATTSGAILEAPLSGFR